jgi:hypothetical protein
MFKSTHLLCTSLIALSMGLLQADSPDDSDSDFFSSFPAETLSSPNLTADAAPAPKVIEAAPVVKKEKPKGQFKNFTGKVKGKKVRLRTQPDLDSSIVKELQRGEYLSIIDEMDDFWVTEAPADLKAYVFRSFILDNVIEGTRVNVRLHPNTEAPILVHLNSGDPVNGEICEENHKWLEISAPKESRFYVSKNFIENVGGPDVKETYDNRLTLVKNQLSTAEEFSKTEMQKEYNEIDFDQMNQNFQIVIQEFADFPDLAEKAKEQLTVLQEKFIDKRIAYMETKADQLENEKSINSSLTVKEEEPLKVHEITDKMKAWEPVEEAIFASWARVHEARELSDFQLEQKIAAERITGILEPYLAPIKSKPGDYLVRHNDLPVGYVYSTVVNLQSLVGKKVSLIASPRPNNNFAFPAYFVIGVE